jgi:hypothetical protein
MSHRDVAGSNRLGLAVAAGLAAFGLARGEALVIDDWSAPHAASVLSPDGTATTLATGSGILGGEREITVTRSSGVAITMAASGGSLAHGQIAGSLGTGEVIWDGTDGGGALDPIGLGGVDLTDALIAAAISISLFFDDVPLSLALTVWTDAANASEMVVSLPGGIPPDPPLGLVLAFASFTVVSGAGADFTNVGAVRLAINGSASAGLDLEIGPVETVAAPDPATGLLFAGGLFGLGLTRRMAGRRRAVLSGG